MRLEEKRLHVGEYIQTYDDKIIPPVNSVPRFRHTAQDKMLLQFTIRNSIVLLLVKEREHWLCAHNMEQKIGLSLRS